MAQIEINGMNFFAAHGCFPEEQLTGSQFTVDIAFTCDTQGAEYSDNLNETVDYQDVYNIIKAEMAIHSKLLEHVGRRIVDAVKEKYPTLRDVRVKVSKCHPPIGGKVDNVSVVIN